MSGPFEVVACHSDHAGKAHLSIRRPNGTEIAIRHLLFEPAVEPLEEQQRHILIEAAQIARATAEYLEICAKRAGEWPTQETKPGASPRETEAPNAYGQQLSPG